MSTQLVPSSRHLIPAAGGAIVAAANALRNPAVYDAVRSSIPAAADFTRNAYNAAYREAKRWFEPGAEMNRKFIGPATKKATARAIVAAEKQLIGGRKKKNAFSKTQKKKAGHGRKGKKKGNQRYHIEKVKIREECLGNVVSSGTANAFSSTSFALNIGNLTTHPIMSTMAPMFQRFRYTKLKFRFQTMSATAIASSTSSTLGSTLMNWQPDPVALAFPDQIHMEEFGMVGQKKICKEAVIFKNNYFSVDCSKSRNAEPEDWLYVLPNSTGTTISTPTAASVHEYSHGTFQVASVGVQGTSQVLGRLFVAAEVEFAVCAIPPPNTQTMFAHFYGTTPTTANNFATATFQAGGTLTGVTVTANQINFPTTITSGIFMYLVIIRATSTTAITQSTKTRCAGYNLLASVSAPDAGFSLGVEDTSTTISQYVEFVNVTGVAPTISFNASVINAGTAVDLYIIGLPSNVSAIPPEPFRMDSLESKFAKQQIQIAQLMKALDLQCADTGQKRLMPPDSDFDDDDCKTVSNSSSSSSSLSGGGLSNSTILQVVEHLKSSSHKK